MTTFIEARDYITEAFDMAWASITPIAYPNKKFTLPSEGPWVRFNILNNFSSQITLGSTGGRVFRRQGIVVIQVFVPEAEGLVEGDTLTLKALEIFEGKQIQNIWFRNASIQEVGPDKVWFQYNVSADFLYDQIK